ncbi:MAG: ABC transporter substrate-binding protein [Gemmatimonas sp.]
MTQIRPILVFLAATLLAACPSPGDTGVSSVNNGGGPSAANSQLKTGRKVEGIYAIGVGATPGKPGYEGVTRGMQLAVDRLNSDAAGSLRFTIATPASATSTIQIAQQLRDDPSVIAVVGHPESGTSIEAIPVYADVEHGGRNAVVAISPTASSPSLTGISPWFFRVAPSDNEAARLVAHYVADSLGATTVAIVYRNDSYGRDWSARFADTYSGKTTAVLARIPYLTGITEWKAYALQLKKLAPQVLLFPGDADDATAMLRELKANDVHLTFVGGDGTEGLARTHEFPDAKYAAFFLPERATSTEGKRFVDSYLARFNEAPDMFAALSYDAALAIGRTVIAGAHSRDELRVKLGRITDATAIEGAGGKIAFNAQRDITGRTVVIATVGAEKTGVGTKAHVTENGGAK